MLTTTPVDLVAGPRQHLHPGRISNASRNLQQLRTKRHVTADLKQQGGLELVKKLVATADIFVENFRPGVAERLGLGFAALSARNTKLVYTSLSAFGAVGPFGGRPAFDHVVQAHTGIMSTTGPEGSGPTKVGAPYVSACSNGRL